MNIGKLNRRIEVYKKTVVRDAYGGETITWTKYQDLWAHIKYSSGTEYIQAEQVKAENTATITIRCNHNIIITDRVKYFNKTYEITSIMDSEESHKETVLLCKELVDGV